METLLGNLVARSSELTEAVRSFLDMAGASKIDIRKWRSGHELTADAIISRAGALADTTAALAASPEDRLALAPTDRLIHLADELRQLAESVGRFTEAVCNIRDSGGMASYDGSAIVHTVNGSEVNVKTHLDEMLSFEDTALQSYAVVASWARPKGIGTFAAASRVLAGKAQEAGEVLEQIREKFDELDRKIQSVASKEESIAGSQGEAERLTSEIEKSRKTSEENEQRVSAVAATIEEIRTKAVALEADVQQYQDKFNSFQSHLDTREKSLTKGNEELKKLQTSLSERGEEITKLVDQAKEMLGSATIAGLSAAYQNQASNVDKQLWWARGGFYLSIVLLVASVAVATNLTALVGFAPLPTIQPGTDAGMLAVQTLASLGSRALVILPGLLLAGFAAHRHSTLFRLREEYNHKSALAASVHGFKTQAPEHEQAIAAAVFQELLSNPAATMDKASEKRRENGFIARLITPAIERSLKKMLELRDGAVSH